MKTVLIVDNMISIRTLVKTVLINKGISVLEAADGNTMFKILKQNHTVDLILMDLGLNGVSGEDLIKELRDNPDTKDIKIAAFTGDSSFSTLKKLSKYNIIDYIIKPIKMDEFCQRINKLLDGKKNSDEGKDFLEIEYD